MAKSVTPQNEQLAADIIKEGAAGKPDPAINQATVKENAVNMGQQAAAGDKPADTVMEGTQAANVSQQPAAGAASLSPGEGQQHPYEQLAAGLNAGLTHFPGARAANAEEVAEFLKWRDSKEAKASEKAADEDAMGQFSHADLLQKYGPGYIMAKHEKTKELRPFSRVTWDRLGGNKNQDGWRETVKTPPEVKNMQ